jgi:hypothetical protein
MNASLQVRVGRTQTYNGNAFAEVARNISPRLAVSHAPCTIIGGLTMRTDKERSGQIDRRRLLKGVGLTVGAAAATSAAANEAVAAAHDDNKPQHAGYRESDDVKTYYKTARF